MPDQLRVSWSAVSERLLKARHYWLVTVGLGTLSETRGWSSTSRTSVAWTWLASDVRKTAIRWLFD